MNLDCSAIQQIIMGYSLVRECELINPELLRMTTPFTFANGDSIELFLKKDLTNSLFPELTITDMGFTTDYLLDLHMKPWATKRRQQIVDEICRSLDVEYDKGALCTRLSEGQPDLLPEALVRLSQACVRMADLILTQRLRTVGVFREEVEEAIAGLDIPYEPTFRLVGKYGKEVEVDYKVTGKHVVSLVTTLSTSNTSAAHALCNEVFRRWYDLDAYRRDHQFVTLYDTCSNAYRDEDLKRLEDCSVLLGYPAQETDFATVLAA